MLAAVDECEWDPMSGELLAVNGYAKTGSPLPGVERVHAEYSTDVHVEKSVGRYKKKERELGRGHGLSKAVVARRAAALSEGKML